MYEYHNNLRATHAASSPWWAWPRRPQARLVLPAELRGPDGRGDLRRRQPRHLVALHPGVRLRRLAGVPPPQPRAGPGDDHVRVAVAALGEDRPGDLPVPLLHGAAVRAPRPGVLRGGGLARPDATDLAAGTRRRRGRRAGAGGDVAVPRATLRPDRRGEGQPGLAGVLERRLHVRVAVGAARRHPRRACRGGRGAGVAAAGPRPGRAGGRRPRRDEIEADPPGPDRGDRGGCPGRGLDPAAGHAADRLSQRPRRGPGARAARGPGPAGLPRLDRGVAPPIRGRGRAGRRLRLRRCSTRTSRACRSPPASTTGTRASCRPGSTRSSSPSTPIRPSPSPWPAPGRSSSSGS